MWPWSSCSTHRTSLPRTTKVVPTAARHPTGYDQRRLQQVAESMTEGVRSAETDLHAFVVVAPDDIARA